MPKKKTPPASILTEPNPAAVQLGRLGGNATARRGSDYYCQIQAKRKHCRGGRSKKAS